MTIKKAANNTIRSLANIYDEREATTMVTYLFEDLFGITNIDREDEFAHSIELDGALKRLLKKEPLQYVIGYSDFFGYKYKVNQHVLIPRPETEELVAWILEDVIHKGKQLDVLDIGTGSGCIALTLKKKLPAFRMFALDYHMDTLNVARINSRKLKAPVQFYNIDFLDEELWSHLGMFDIIVSNPPYIAEEDRHVMADNVLLYEPEKALFAGDDPLVFYKKIRDFAHSHLKEGGRVYMEIHEDLSEEVVQLFDTDKLEVAVRNDLQGKARMVRVGSKIVM